MSAAGAETSPDVVPPFLAPWWDGRMLLHLALEGDWEAAQAAGTYGWSTRDATIDEVGFVHCCRDDAQLDGVRQRFYGDVTEPLVVLVLDADSLVRHGLRVVDEPPFPGADDTFPHVYGGPVPVDVVRDVRLLGARSWPHSIARLDRAMTSPYPSVRDGWAYAELAAGIHEGRWGATELAEIGMGAVARLRHERAEVRSFALLTLRWLADVGVCERTWFDEATRVWSKEQDTRGYDERVGWVHAVAHGADLQAAGVRARLTTPRQALVALVARAAAEDVRRYEQQEDARLAHAMIVALSAPGVSAQDCVAWQAVVDGRRAAFEADPTTPPPVWLANLQGTLAWLSLALDAGPLAEGKPVVVEHVEPVREAVAQVHARLAPWLLRGTRH